MTTAGSLIVYHYYFLIQVTYHIAAESDLFDFLIIALPILKSSG